MEQTENSGKTIDLATARELADRLNVSLMTTTNWIREGCPILRRRPYIFDFDAVQAWLRARGDRPGPTPGALRQRRVQGEADAK